MHNVHSLPVCYVCPSISWPFYVAISYHDFIVIKGISREICLVVRGGLTISIVEDVTCLSHDFNIHSSRCQIHSCLSVF